jgi:hypothetical protein
MKKIAGIFWVAVLFFTSSCTPINPDYIGLPAGLSKLGTSTPTATDTPNRAFRSPPVVASWQIQYTGKMDYILDVNVYNLDLFDTSADSIAQLHERGIFVMCYFSAGSFEDWRSDAVQFPQQVLGKNLEDWAGEKWLDIRQIESLSPLMAARLDLAVQKDCDGVDPDNLNGYENDTGFPLTANDQIAYNIFLSTQAHARGLSVGLKNDLNQVSELFPFFDWALNEECFSYAECHLLAPFIKAGKPVFVIEYDLSPEEFCFQANDLNFNALQKNRELDAFRFQCR